MRDQRLHPRINVNWTAELKIAGADEATPGRIKDISLKGTYLEADIELAVGQKILLKMHARIGERIIPIVTIAAVTRRILLAHLRGYGYGIALMQIRTQDVPILQRILGEALANPAPPRNDRRTTRRHLGADPIAADQTFLVARSCNGCGTRTHPAISG